MKQPGSEAARKAKRRRRWRLLGRCAAFAAAVVLAACALPWSWSSLVLPSLSPFVLVASAVAARSVGLAALVGMPVLVLVVFRRRWFCRYVCPVGLLTEQAGRLRRGGKRWTRRLPRVGTWIVLLTLGGACFGYPVLLWLDPLPIFQGVFRLWQTPLSPAGRASAAVLAAILVLSAILPGAWCLRVCPLGATQELLHSPWRKKGVRSVLSGLSRAKSVGCVLARTSESRGLRVGASTHPTGFPTTSSVLSGLSRAKGAERAPGARSVPRRSILSAGFGALCAGFGAKWAIDRWFPIPDARGFPLRPPGAVDEWQFTGLCVRCGNCLRACPTGILEPDERPGRVAGWLAPVVRFREGYCREDCRACTQVCPSGAIARLPLDRKRAWPIGLAVLDPSICYLYYDRECDICARMCPYEAIEIVWNEAEYIALPRVDAEKCPGCGACEAACPGTNEWEREHAAEPIPLRKAIAVRWVERR